MLHELTLSSNISKDTTEDHELVMLGKLRLFLHKQSRVVYIHLCRQRFFCVKLLDFGLYSFTVRQHRFVPQTVVTSCYEVS